MATRTRIVPEHEYPHVMVVEHDNSQRPNDKAAAVLQTYCNMLFVIASPKGKDREIQTIDGGYADFIEHYGLGSFDDYGQPYLNALNAASTDAATLYILRVTAENATYAGGALVAHYRVTPPKTVEPEPEPEPVSDLIDILGHENVVAYDSTDEATGVITINVAGTDVEPGISPENTDLFGDVDSTDCIDVGIKLDKIVLNLDPDKEYQITQVNPMLGKYLDKDENVSAEGSSFKKVKVYSGADLADDSYIVLLGTDTVNVKVVEWGVKETEPVVDVIITNNTDLYVTMNDDKGHITVTKTGNVYDVQLTGEVIPEIINPTLWGDIDETEYNEVNMMFPTVAGAQYHVVTRNDEVHELYPSDSRIHEVTVNGETFKIREQDLDGGVLNADDADNGLSYLMPAKGIAWIKFYDAESFVSVETSTPVFTVNISSNCTYVAEHPLPPVPKPEALGTPTEIVVESTLAFVGEKSNVSTLRAKAALNKMTRLAKASVTTDAVDEDLKGKMEVYYTFEPLENVTDLTMLGELVEVDREMDANGFTAVKVFEVASKGRGIYGNNTRFVIENYARGDKLCNYKNYTFTVYEIDTATLVKKEYFTVSFLPDAVSTDGVTLFLDYIAGDPYENSEYIEVRTNPLAFRELHEAYMNAVPDSAVTVEQFDPLLGKVYANNLARIPQFYILDEVPVIEPDSDVSEQARATAAATKPLLVNAPSGIAFGGGDDGDFTIGSASRKKAMEDAYLRAWSGEIDRNIYSRKLYPTDIILDADYPVETKNAISDLVHIRKDCIGFFDLGIKFNTFEGMLDTLADVEPFISTRDESVEAYYGKVQDPKTYKIITVSSTYPLARMYPLHFQANGAKHVALAGASYGVLNGYINRSAYPVFDDDLEEDRRQMDQMVDARVNYLKVNTLKQVVRATQTTRQDADTNLSECSNVFVLHDIRRDCIMLCEQYEYNFAEASDLQRFNKSAGIIADKYRAAQVSSISAVFEMTEWEAERGILHLYVEFVHKRIIKRSIVEIDINRGSVVV